LQPEIAKKGKKRKTGKKGKLPITVPIKGSAKKQQTLVGYRWKTQTRKIAIGSPEGARERSCWVKA